MVALSQVASDCRQAIVSLISEGFTTFLTGMSQGFDLIAALEVLSLKSEYPSISLIAVVPFLGQADSYSERERECYDAVLGEADRVVCMDDHYTSSKQYLRRNDLLINHSSHLLCYYDGQRGGTMYTYNRALRSHIPITNICKINRASEGTLF